MAISLQSPRQKSVRQKGNGDMLKEFKDFIARGNVMDMAVGIIIGAALTPSSPRWLQT